MNSANDLLVTMSVDELKGLIQSEVKAVLDKHLEIPAPLKEYRLKEAADILGVHFHTLRVYTEQGVVESFKVGNRVLITLAAINDFIEKGGSDRPTQPKAYK